MTLEEKFSKTLDYLLERTEKGEIRWEPSTGESFTPSRPVSFIVIEVEAEGYYPGYRLATSGKYGETDRRLDEIEDEMTDPRAFEQMEARA